MQTKLINCPNCNKPLEYWTLSNQIECAGCREIIAVEPCEPEAPEIIEPIEENIELIEVEV